MGVILFNLGDKDFEVAAGDRVAQLILEKVDLAAVEEVEELPDTARGAGGFGSTGVAASEPDVKRPKTDEEVAVGPQVQGQ